MITVRFPTGLAVQYNSAHYVVWASETYPGGHKLYTGKDGDLVCVVPVDAIVEWQTPCRVYRDAQEPGVLVEAILKLLETKPWLPALKDLKRALARYDARRGSWR